MAELDRNHASYEMGMHTAQLAGRSQQAFFLPEEEENFTYPWSYEVDFEKSAVIDAADIGYSAVNLQIRDLMKQGVGTITVRNPRAQHSLGVGILNRLQLNFEGSLGYFVVMVLLVLQVRLPPLRRPNLYVVLRAQEHDLFVQGSQGRC